MNDLPPGWATAQLDELISADGMFVDGDWVESKDQDPHGTVRLTQLADIGEGLFRDRSNRFLTLDKARKLRCSFLQPGDVLIARMPDPLGRACLYPGSSQPAVTAVDVCIIRPGSNGVNPRWLMWIINSPQVREQIKQYESGTTRKRISRRHLALIRISVPPMAEQDRIVTALEDHLSRLEVGARSLLAADNRMSRLWQSALNRVVAGEVIGRETLPTASIGEVAEVQGGIQKQPKRKPLKNKYPFLRVANVPRGNLDLDEIHEMELFDGELDRYRLRAGDLLVVEGNGSPEQIGRAAIWHDEIADCVHQNHLIRVRPGPKLDPQYLELVWNSPVTSEHLRSVASSTSGLHTLSTAKVKSVRIPVPPRRVQEELAVEADRMRSQIDATRVAVGQARQRAAALRRSLLAEAFAGRLVVQDPADEPASVLLERIGVERAAQPKVRRGRETARHASQEETLL